MIYEPISLDSASRVPMYRQLYESIRDRIGAGALEVGEKMPSIRCIAEELGVSRTTVEQAYQQLCVEGYLVSRPQSGYYVEAAVRSEILHADENREEKEPPGVRYDFGSRYVDMRGSDIELWRKYVRSVCSRFSRCCADCWGNAPDAWASNIPVFRRRSGCFAIFGWRLPRWDMINTA